MEGQETRGSAATQEDVSLRDTIRKRLDEQRITGIRIDVCSGDVVLSGEVHSEDVHDRIVDVVQTVPGVHGVMDAIEVTAESGGAETHEGADAVKAEQDRHVRHKSPKDRPTTGH